MRNLQHAFIISDYCSLSKLSHELNNPLTIISSTLQLLTYSHPELSKDELWLQLSEDINYMKLILKDLSDYNTGHKVNLIPTDITPMLSQIKQAFDPLAMEQQKDFHLYLQKDLPLLQCDVIKFKQALINLVKNAFEATDAHDTIDIHVTAKWHRLLITVSDSGSGIPKNHLNSIFQTFTTYKKDGTGLGLPITQQIVHAHGGTIQVFSTEGSGSKFILNFPIHIPCTDTHVMKNEA